MKLNKNSTLLDNTSAVLHSEPEINSFRKFSMTNKSRKSIETMKYLVDGFLVQGYHTYLFGNSGSGKTTIAFYLSREILEKYQEMQIVFFYIDGALSMAGDAHDMFEELKLNNRITITEKGSTNEYIEIIKESIENKIDFKNTLFIFDTFKYMTNDINNKNANKKAMELIKNFCHITGATFLSLGHTNKDGKNQSGTAEIEQDSDAIFRIDTIDKGDTSISTISIGGRVRLDPKEQSFEFTRGDIKSVKRLNEIKDIESILKVNKEEENDKNFIIEVEDILKTHAEIKQTDLVKLLKNTGLGEQNIIKKLKNYSEKKWYTKKGNYNSNIYHLNEN